MSPKQAAGEAGAALVESGMRVGLGTGSTAAEAVRALGRRVRDEGLRIEGTPTSFSAERMARELGIPLVPLDDVERLDLALDGADEVDPDGGLIKGGGGAHSREKVVAALAERFVALVDPSKEVERLGTRSPVPVEVIPMAVGPVRRRLLELGAARVELREGPAKDGPTVTDQGLWLLDAHFDGGIEDAEALADALDATPGVLDHGLFLGMTRLVLVGEKDGSVRRR